MTYQEIKTEQSNKYNELMEKAGVFWAFSNEQFEEGFKKANLKEGEKLVRIPGGGYCPKKNFDTLLEDIEKANTLNKKALKALKEERTTAILYELKNYECFYTGNIYDVINIFKGIYTEQEILTVYKNNLNN